MEMIVATGKILKTNRPKLKSSSPPRSAKMSRKQNGEQLKSQSWRVWTRKQLPGDVFESGTLKKLAWKWQKRKSRHRTFQIINLKSKWKAINKNGKRRLHQWNGHLTNGNNIGITAVCWQLNIVKSRHERKRQAEHSGHTSRNTCVGFEGIWGQFLGNFVTAS